MGMREPKKRQGSVLKETRASFWDSSYNTVKKTICKGQPRTSGFALTSEKKEKMSGSSSSPCGCGGVSMHELCIGLTLYMILHCQYCMVYGIRKGGFVRGRTVCNKRAIVSHCCGQCKWGEAIQG